MQMICPCVFVHIGTTNLKLYNCLKQTSFCRLNYHEAANVRQISTRPLYTF